MEMGPRGGQELHGQTWEARKAQQVQVCHGSNACVFLPNKSKIWDVIDCGLTFS
jgi:hypothetical protein